jgi:Sugar (and other) transporter
MDKLDMQKCESIGAVWDGAGALTNTVFLSMYHRLQWGAFIIFGSVAAGAAVFCFIYLPETKGRTLLEVQALLATPEEPKEARRSMGAPSTQPGVEGPSNDVMLAPMMSSSLLRSGGFLSHASTPWLSPWQSCLLPNHRSSKLSTYVVDK